MLYAGTYRITDLTVELPTCARPIENEPIGRFGSRYLEVRSVNDAAAVHTATSPTCEMATAGELMIQSEAELLQSLECMSSMYRALAELHRRIAPQNFRNYLVLAEGPIDEIGRLRHEIDAYLGIGEPIQASSQAG